MEQIIKNLSQHCSVFGIRGIARGTTHLEGLGHFLHLLGRRLLFLGGILIIISFVTVLGILGFFLFLKILQGILLVSFYGFAFLFGVLDVQGLFKILIVPLQFLHFPVKLSKFLVEPLLIPLGLFLLF